MLKYYYYITNKYIYIYIYVQIASDFNYLLYQGFFCKHIVDWFTFCNSFKEFLYEVGLIKCRS